MYLKKTGPANLGVARRKIWAPAARCLWILLPLFGVPAAAQLQADIQMANDYAVKFKDDRILCTNSYQLFTFDKGSNSLGDKVVEIKEEGEYDFLALKKYASITYPEFYNQFITLNSFKRATKFRNRYVVSEKAGIDRSVTDQGIFFDDSRVQYYPIRFAQKGDMARISVKKTYTDGKYLTRLFFSSHYPIKEQVMEFKIPDWLTVDFKKINFEGHKVETRQERKGGYVYHAFIMKDIPAYKQEYRRIGRAYTDPHIVVQIKSFENKGEVLKGFDKVDDVYVWNNRLYKKTINDKAKLQAFLPKIIMGKTTDTDKIKAIFYWVQDNIRYIAYEDGYSGYVPTAAQDVLEKKYGDCKGMANLLTELLTLAGYDAHFSWIGTRHLPYPQSLPALCVNNHAISTLNFGGKTYFLDATESYVPFGENAFRIQGKEALIANGNKFEIKAVPATTADDNKIATTADFVLSGDKLSGKVKVEMTGNQRTEFHQTFQSLRTTKQQEALNDYLEFGNDNMLATNVKTSDLKNRDLPVTIEGDLDLSNTVNNISGEKYVGVDFFPKSLDRFIPDEKRVEGYDLDEVIKFEDNISITLPAGSQFMDKPENLELKEEGYEFKGIYTQNGNKMTLHKSLVIKNSMIKKGDFPNWKKFIEAIKEFNKYLVSIKTI